MSEGSEVGVAYVTLVVSGRGIVSGIQQEMAGVAGVAATSGTKAGMTFGPAMLGALKKALPVAAVVGALKGLYEIGQTFEEANNTIIKATGASGEALAGLEQSVKNVASTSSAKIGDIGTAIGELNTRTGLTGLPLETMASLFLKLSKITKTDLSSDIANMTRVFAAWNITAEKQPLTLDKIFRASQLTGIGVDALSTSVVKFGPTLAQMGFDFDQSTALIAQFEKEGVNTGPVLAAMKMGLANLSKAGEDPPKALARLTEEIKNAGSGAEANKIAMEVFGKRAGPELAADIRSGKLEIGDLVAALGDSEGAIKSTAKETRTLSTVFALLKNKVLVGLEPIATKVLGALTDFGLWFVDKGIPAIEAFGKAVWEKLAPFLKPLGELIAKVFGAFKEGDLEGSLSGIGDAISKAAPFILGKLGDLAQKFIEWIGPMIPPMLAKLAEWLGALLVWLKDVALPAIWAKLIEWGKAFIDWLIPALPGILKKLAEIVVKIQVWLVTEALPAIVTGLAKLAWELLKALGELLLPLAKVMAQPFIDAWNAIKASFWTFVDWLKGVPGWIKEKFVGAGAWLLQIGKDIITGLWDGIKAVFWAVVHWLWNLGSEIKGALGDLGLLLYDAGKAVMKGFWNGLKEVWGHGGGGVFGWFLGLPGIIANIKGPIDRDRTILEPAGRAVMEGFLTGLKSKWVDVESFLREAAAAVAHTFEGGIAAEAGLKGSGQQSQLREHPPGPDVKSQYSDAEVAGLQLLFEAFGLKAMSWPKENQDMWIATLQAGQTPVDTGSAPTASPSTSPSVSAGDMSPAAGVDNRQISLLERIAAAAEALRELVQQMSGTSQTETGGSDLERNMATGLMGVGT